MNPSSTAKTILFWLSIVLLGVMLWRLVSANGQAAREDTPSYSEFMAHVDQGDVKEVTMYLSPNSYELQGEYVKPANKKFHTTIFKEDAPNLSKVLREKQVLINVKEVRSGDWLIILLNALPLLLWDEPLNDLKVKRHLQKQLRTGASDWQGFVTAYKAVWPKFS